MACTTSCLKSGDEITLYDDAVIASFTLGTLNRYVHTISSTGADSVYRVAITGSKYVFNIDQVGHRIFNSDSLPLGADVTRVPCTIGVRNNGTLLIRDATTDTLRYHVATDSIDFTKPRQFVVLSSDGMGRTEYDVRVSAYQEDPDVFTWTLVEGTAEPAADSYSLPMDGISKIIGKSSTETYALSNTNRLMVWRNGGSQWEEDVLDDDASLLPTQDVNIVCYPMELSDKTDYVLMAGNRDKTLYPQETTARVWRKIVDYGSQTQTSKWVYMERAANEKYQLPRMENLQLVNYDDGVLAFGAPYTAIYQSRDNGITWKETKTYKMPAGFNSSATSVRVVVDNNNIWLFCRGTGQVWRGCLNRLR